MGPNFNLTKWADQWLTTSGVNTLEPNILYDNNYIRQLNIRQLANSVGNNQLRKQKIDIAVFGEDYEGHLLHGIILNDTLENNLLALNLQKQFPYPVSAVIINPNEKAYDIVYLDQKSYSNLKLNLHKVHDPVIRAVVWHQVWQMLMDQRISSAEYFNFTMSQLPMESNEEILQLALKNLKEYFDYYMPMSIVKNGSK
jgi:aminopeptidase N